MIENTNVYKMYTADGTQRQWEFPYSYVEDNDMRVYQKHDTTLTRVSSSLYTFDPVTKKVTYPKDQDSDPVPAGDIILIWRWTDVTQEEDSAIANFKSNDVERMTDKLTMICQELSDRLDRSITWDPTELDPDTDAVTLVESLEQYADDAVSAHNTSNTAHADIRSDISSLQSSKVNVSDVKSTFNPIDSNPINGIGVQAAVSAEATLRENADNGLQSQITSLGNNKQDNLTTAQLSAVNSGIDSTKVAQIGTNTTNISNEVLNRQAGDVALQGQIDALKAASDVVDVVATYAELQAYDTSKLTDKDLIKVLSDSTHNNAETYYRWAASSSSFSYVGSAGASYTKAEADAKFLSQTDAASTYVNNTAFSTALATKASSADGTTITDSGFAISTVAVKEQRANVAIKEWVGTTAQLPEKDSNTLYVVTDEDDSAFLTVDSTLSSTSENPVQNKAIYAALQNVDSLPSQSGQSGKFLTTDGTEASWATVQGGGGASFLSGATAPTSGTNADMAGQTYVNTSDGSLYVCQALTGGDPTTYYTVVGNPTINSSYVASNFGSNSYVDTGVTFRPSGAWNIKMKFNFGMTSSTWYKLTGNTGNAVSIGIEDNKIKLECSSTGSGWDICAFTCSTVIQAGRDYWIDFGFDGTNLYYVDLSTDGVTYTRDGSATSTKKVYSSSTMGLGCAFSGYTSHYFVGSIYLTDFEIYEATELTYRAVSLGGPLWKSAASLAMPSDVYDDLTLGASGTSYTMPANGWLFLDKTNGTTDRYILFRSSSVSIPGEYTCCAPGTNTHVTLLMPVKKGDIVNVLYNATGTTNYFRFIYAEGSKSEAN